MTAQLHRTDTPAVWYSDDLDAWVYRASSLSSCHLLLARTRAGFDGAAPPKSMQQRFDDGHLHEPDIVARIIGEKPGWTLNEIDPDTGEQWLVTLWLREPTYEPNGQLLKPGLVILGHTDGLAINPIANPDSRIVEAKAFSQANYDKATRLLDRGVNHFWDAYPYYAVQATLYMDHFEVPMFYGIKNKNSGDLRTFTVDEQPLAMAPIIARIMAVEGMAARDQMPDQCDVRTYPCPFYLNPGCRHGEGVEEDPEKIMAKALGAAPAPTMEPSPLSTDELAGALAAADPDEHAEFLRLCSIYRTALETEKKAEAAKKEAARKLGEQFLGGGEDAELEAGTAMSHAGFKAYVKPGTRRWLDEDAMAEDGIELGEYRRTSHYTYVQVSPPKQ